MFGPVFLLEWKNASRRSRHRRFRAVYAALVAAEFAFFLWAWLSRGIDPWLLHHTPARISAEVAGAYLPVFTVQHLLLLLLVTPGLAASSITDEKTRGTLTLLLTTELTAREIVLGKWLGQAVQVLVLALPAVPLIAFLQGMCGLTPVVAGAWLIESVLLALLLSALSMLASVWAQKTSTAVVAVYLLLTAALAGAWAVGWGGAIDRLTLILPAYGGISAAWPELMLASAGLTVLCVALAAWRLRSACTAEAMHRPRARWWAWLDRPALGIAPMRWKERYVGELGPFTFARELPRWAGVCVALSLGLAAAWFLPGDDEIFVAHGVGLIAVVALLVAIRSSGAVCRERERQTWDALLTSPLEPNELVRGKLWGIIDSVKPYLLAYLIGALVWAIPNGGWPVFYTLVGWLMVWPFLYFHAANGLYRSTCATGSWPALLQTLASGLAMELARMPFAIVVAMVIVVSLSCFLGLPLFVLGLIGSGSVEHVVRAISSTTYVTVICVVLFAEAERLLQQAIKHIVQHERVEQGSRPWEHRADWIRKEAHAIRL